MVSMSMLLIHTNVPNERAHPISLFPTCIVENNWNDSLVVQCKGTKELPGVTTVLVGRGQTTDISSRYMTKTWRIGRSPRFINRGFFRMERHSTIFTMPNGCPNGLSRSAWRHPRIWSVGDDAMITLFFEWDQEALTRIFVRMQRCSERATSIGLCFTLVWVLIRQILWLPSLKIWWHGQQIPIRCIRLVPILME